MGNGASASDVITGGEGRIGTKWNWEYEYGSFEVEFMASGVFFCEKARDLSPLGARPRFALGDRARPTLERAPLALARPRSLVRAREQYPRNATWTLTENKLVIDWKDLGTYEMTVDPAGRAMSGCYQGYPEDWRKATLVAEATEERKHVGGFFEHDHEHANGCAPHEHGPAAGGCAPDEHGGGGC